MRSVLLTLVVGLTAAPAAAQIGYNYATPLPPGPGTVALPIPGGPLAAPVLLPVGAPTAQPVAIYTYGGQAYGGQAYGGQTTYGSEPTVAGASEPAPSTAGRTFYFAADFLYAATQGVYVPPLVTIAPPASPAPTAGALFGSPVVFGGGRLVNQLRPGFRLNAGTWFGCDGMSGIDLGFFALGGLSDHFIGSSGPGGVVLARPLVNGLTATNIGLPAAGPFPGGITASVDTSFLGGDANYRHRLVNDCNCKLDVLAGFRYLHLGDSVDVWQTSALAPNPAALAVPTAGALVHDYFSTRNNFYGPQIGLIAQRTLGGGFFVELLTKVALGVTAATADTDASTRLASGLAAPTGVLVGPDNRVSTTTTYFGVVPEVGAKVGYSVTDTFRVTAGYTFLYWSKVRRASEQIDLTTFAPGRPAFRSQTTDVWMQGWTLGVEWRY